MLPPMIAPERRLLEGERRGQSPSLPIGRPGPGDCQLRQSESSLKQNGTAGEKGTVTYFRDLDLRKSSLT